jgi:hypothetical protein
VRGGGSAAPPLAARWERIGWGAVRESSTEELASHLVYLVDACVHDHYEPTLLAHEIAAMLRDHGPLLAAGCRPVDAYVPARRGAAAAVRLAHARGPTAGRSCDASARHHVRPARAPRRAPSRGVGHDVDR